MDTSNITVDVVLDRDKIPHEIEWSASQSSSDGKQKAKAMALAFWDGAERAAFRIDLWTKEMMVDEMAEFYYQNLMGLADSFERATHQQELVGDLRTFAGEFYRKFRKIQQEAQQKGL
jgi:gliding motility-associated protein GldC